MLNVNFNPNKNYPKQNVSFQGETEQLLFKKAINLAGSKDVFKIETNIEPSIKNYFDKTYSILRGQFGQIFGMIKDVNSADVKAFSFKNLDNEEITITKEDFGISYSESKSFAENFFNTRNISFDWDNSRNKLIRTQTIKSGPLNKINDKTSVIHETGVVEEFNPRNNEFINPNEISRVHYKRN